MLAAALDASSSIDICRGKERRLEGFADDDPDNRPTDVTQRVDTMASEVRNDAAFLTVSLEDMRYLYVSAIDNMASLDNNPFEGVVEAMGEDGFDEMMSGYENTFETHTNYIINLNHDMSYKSDVILNEGVNFS